jgi:predicted ATPase
MISRFFMATAIYAIIGGPSAGKTSIIKELQADGQVTIEESSTQIIKNKLEKNIKEPWLKDGFQLEIFTKKLQLEKEMLKSSKGPIFIDRGLLDNLVYLEISGKENSSEYKEIKDQLATLDIKNRYAAVFFIEPHANKNFQLEKNEIRRESTKEALNLSEKIKAAYSKHYDLIIIPGGITPSARAALIKQKVNALKKST